MSKTKRHVIEWHNAQTDPPTESGFYLALNIHHNGQNSAGFIFEHHYSEKRKLWNAFDDVEPLIGVDYAPPIAWAELPSWGKLMQEFGGFEVGKTEQE